MEKRQKARLAVRLYRHFPPYRTFIRWSRRFSLPLLGGVPVYWIIKFFRIQLQEEPLALRASSIAFNLFLALLPGLIAMFTLLPYIPVEDLNKYVLSILGTLMPASAFSTIEETLNSVLATRSGGLFSFGLVAAIYFASNGIFSLITTLHKEDPRSFWQQKLISFGLTFLFGFIIISGLCLFLMAQFLIELLGYRAHINDQFLYFTIVILQWVVTMGLLFGAIIILFRQGDPIGGGWRAMLPGALLSSFLVLATSIAYSFYVARWANYNKLYGSLGAMIITLLWLYLNAMVIIIGHDFNRSLYQARLIVQGRQNARQAK